MLDYKNSGKIFKLSSKDNDNSFCYADFIRSTILDNNKEIIETTESAMLLLDCLLSVPGRTCSFQELITNLDLGTSASDSNISMRIGRLRKTHSTLDKVIVNRRSLGYYFKGSILDVTDQFPEIVNNEPINEIYTGEAVPSDRKRPFVFFSSRRTVDQKYPLSKLKDAKEILCLSLTAASLLHSKALSPDPHYSSASDMFLSLNEALIRIILPQSGSIAEKDALMYKMPESNFLGTSEELLRTMRENLIHASLSKNNIEGRFTSCCLPYGILVVNYRDIEKDYIKLDLYDPYLHLGADRHSLIITRKDNEHSFNYYYQQFYLFWQNASLNPEIRT